MMKEILFKSVVVVTLIVGLLMGFLNLNYGRPGWACMFFLLFGIELGVLIEMLAEETLG